MPDFTHEYLASLKDSCGNRCEALLITIQAGDRITGRYAFSLLDQAKPVGWRFPITDAAVEGQLFSARTFPFSNATDNAIAQMQKDGGGGLHARLTIGAQTFYALMLDVNSRCMVLCDRDDIAAVSLPTRNDFEDFSLDIRDQRQLARRRALFKTWLAEECQPEVRSKLETLSSALEAQAVELEAYRKAHLAIQPRRPGQHTDFTGKFRFTADNSYTGDYVEGTIELTQNAAGQITGTYRAPADLIGSVNWFYPTSSGPVSGSTFPARDGWDFETARVYSTWASNESYLGLPGGLREVRIEFCGITRYLLRTRDGCLAMSETESATDGGFIWSKAD